MMGSLASKTAPLVALAAIVLGGCDGDTASGPGGGSAGVAGSAGSAAAGGSAGSSSGGSAGSAGTGGDSMHLAEWVRTFLGTEQVASSTAVDAKGNVYVGGYFTTGAVDFGAGQLDCPPLPGGPTSCGFVLKLDPDGKTLWSRALAAGRTRGIDVPALAAAADGVVIAASWKRTELVHEALDLGTGPLDPPGDNPMVLATFDADGNTTWSAAFGDDMGEVIPRTIVADGPASFTVGGQFSTASLDFGLGPMAFTTQYTMFLAHFAAAKIVWQQSMGAALSAQLAGLGRAADGTLLLAGGFQESLDLGGQILDSNGSWSVFQAGYDKDGKLQSRHAFDCTGGFPSVTGSAVDAAGSTLVTGIFDGTLSLGAPPLESKGNFTAFLAKIDANGSVEVAQASTETMGAVEASYCVQADGANNILWGANVHFIDQASGEDYLNGRISKLDPSGAELWSVTGKSFGAQALAADAKNNVIAAGVFSTELGFAKGGPIKATKGRNAFIAKFSP